MKKRIISMLLTVLMVLSLFSGMGINAYAVTYNGANTIDYTMAQGDFVLRICQRLGLNYYTCKDAIMILNNIRDGQWNTLTVGRTLTLPASDYDALLITNGAGTTVYNSGAAATTATTSTVTGTATTGTATAVNTASSASADKLAYYLVPYTISYGETVSGVCNALGVNFSIFSPFIKQVNNISNWTKVRAGDTLIIPTPVAPAVGTTCYGVMEHTVASKDTAYGITASKGVNYSANERLLKVLNQTDNLASLTAGGKFFYPVPLTVSVPGTGNPGSTTTTTTTTTVTDGNGTSTTSTTTTAKLYKLTGGMAASDGTMLFFVNNQPVTAAPAGAKVTIMTDTADGKAIQGLTVKHADGTADLHLSGDSFIMPSCDARVDAVIKSGHNINIAANYSGKATASVGGISVQSAVKGATVVIKSVDPNYEIASIYATYRKLISSSTKEQLTVSSSKAFVMPDGDVDVEVVLKPVSTYAFYVNDPVWGSFYLQVNGSAATRAAKGAQVTVVAKANEGYEPVKLEVTRHGDSATIVNVFSNNFTMPGFDVDVKVTFGAKGNNILIMPSQFGNVYAFADATADISTDEKLAENAVTEAPTGAKVYLKLIDETGAAPAELTTADYNIDYDIIRNSDGLKVSYDKGDKSFKMPKGGVTVTPVITAVDKKNITAKFFVNSVEKFAADGYNNCSISVTWNGKTSNFTKSGDQVSATKAIKSAIPVGEYIDLRYDDSTDGIAFVKYRIMGAGLLEEETNEANLHGYFKMPNEDITIEAYFETGKTALGPAAITGVGTVTYRNAANTLSINSCDPGDTVLISVVPGNGFSFDYNKYADKLLVTRKDNGAHIEITPVNVVPAQNIFVYSFTMPAAGADVQAIFDAKPFIVRMRCVDETGKSLTGLGLWQVAINLEPGVVDNDPAKTETVFTVAYEDYVTVAMTEAGWSNYDMVSFRVDGKEYTADSLNFFYNFQMIEDRAKDLEIVAVLRPRVPTGPKAHRLIANYLPTMGDVEFILFEQNPITGGDKGTGYARNIDGVNYYATAVGDNINGSRYTSYAFSGDYVGIIANSNDAEYTATLDNISIVPILGDANKIVPTKWDVDSINGDTNNGRGYTVYVFRMPDEDVSISVNFTGKKYDISVVVRDPSGNPINGMIDLFVETSTFTDVAADSTFGSISFNQLVTIMPSTRARAESKVVTKVDVKTKADSAPVYYYDYSAGGIGGSGPVFYMPASDVVVYITVDSPVLANIVNFQFQLDGGTLVARSGPSMTDPVVTEFNVGDEIYVFEIPAAGNAHLDKGDLNITNNGTVYTVANWHATAADGTNVWKVKIPAGLTIFSATWGEPADENGGNGIVVSGVSGGSFIFSLTANMQSATTEYVAGQDLYFNITADSGNGYPAAGDIIVTDKNGTKLTVLGLTPSTSEPARYMIPGSSLPKGGIVVSVKDGELPANTYFITFAMVTTPAAGEGAAIRVNGGSPMAVQDTTGVSLKLNPGDAVEILPYSKSYDAIDVASQNSKVNVKKQSSYTYIVPDSLIDPNTNKAVTTDSIYITLVSTNPAVTVKPMSHGTVYLRKTPTVLPEEAGNFNIGNDVYIQIVPDTGYHADGNIKVLDLQNNSIGATSAEPGMDWEVISIPDGGITISQNFVPDSVTLNYTVNGAEPTAIVADANGVSILGASGAASANYDTVITITLAAGYVWDTNPVTVSDDIKTEVSGNTATFTVKATGTISITLNVKAAE